MGPLRGDAGGNFAGSSMLAAGQQQQSLHQARTQFEQQDLKQQDHYQQQQQQVPIHQSHRQTGGQPMRHLGQHQQLAGGPKVYNQVKLEGADGQYYGQPEPLLTESGLNTPPVARSHQLVQLVAPSDEHLHGEGMQMAASQVPSDFNPADSICFRDELSQQQPPTQRVGASPPMAAERVGRNKKPASSADTQQAPGPAPGAGQPAAGTGGQIVCRVCGDKAR